MHTCIVANRTLWMSYWYHQKAAIECPSLHHPVRRLKVLHMIISMRTHGAWFYDTTWNEFSSYLVIEIIYRKDQVAVIILWFPLPRPCWQREFHRLHHSYREWMLLVCTNVPASYLFVLNCFIIPDNGFIAIDDAAVNSKSLLIWPFDVNYIKIGTEKSLDGPLPGVDTDRYATENTSNFQASKLLSIHSTNMVVIQP